MGASPLRSGLRSPLRRPPTRLLPSTTSPGGWPADARGSGPSALLANAEVGLSQPSIPLSPEDRAGAAVDLAGAKEAITAEWAVLKDGKVSFVKSATPPKNAVKAYGALGGGDGQAVSKDDFLRTWSQANDLFLSYTGKNATAAQIASVLTKGLGTYALTNTLSKAPQFVNSPVWKAHAPGIIGIAKDTLGEGAKVDNDFVRKAIAQGWDQATVQRKIIQMPAYLKSPGFQQKVAGLNNVHQSIFGVPTAQDMTSIREAALGGWSEDQYAAYLRGSDNYRYSPEFQARTLSFLDAMGMFVGKGAVLAPGLTPTSPGQPKFGGPPNSP